MEVIVFYLILTAFFLGIIYIVIKSAVRDGIREGLKEEYVTKAKKEKEE